MAYKSGSASHRPMSIDAMLDMERQEVLALLESKGQQSSSPPDKIRSSSPYAPRSPVRSMLDIPEESAPSQTARSSSVDKSASGRPSPPSAKPVRSMLDIDTPAPPVRSMLDITTPVSPPPINSAPMPSSARQSPVPAYAELSPSSTSQSTRSGSHHRSNSDAAVRPIFVPRAMGGRNDPTSGYQFSGIFSANSGQKLPKRNTQGGKRSSGGSLGEALRGGDFSSLQMPGDRGRHSSVGPRLGNSSRSPHNRLSNRSHSPATFGGLLSPGRAAAPEDVQPDDFSNAYRRLSDANLAFSTGTLAELPLRKTSVEAGEGRLVKDYLGPDGEYLGSSEDEDEAFSTDDEDRGRKKAPRSLSPGAAGQGAESKSRSRSNGREHRPSRSLLAAAEDERVQVASTQPKYQYRSLFDEPEIKVTTSSGKTLKPAKAEVHPNTSYDLQTASATPSIMDSDEEADMDDIKRAQRLSFTMTNILNTPEAHRAIRIIYRGEYNKIIQAADEEHYRQRKYLVATDMSDESTHALEWAIGTVLRDGDTLIAIYCVDEETGIVTGDGTSIPDEPKAMKEQAAVINSVANTKAIPAPINPVTEFRRASAFHFRGDSNSTPGSSPAPAAADGNSKADEERRRAVQAITDRVLRLLRKTKLQVRVVVEVLHCKNPKHLITEVIDLVNPTLVVIGSRGRSALKGVILGSFSNYLVTKSSVPVMVARKRLRKQSKYKKTTVKQVNNLSNPAARSLANAKID